MELINKISSSVLIMTPPMDCRHSFCSTVLRLSSGIWIHKECASVIISLQQVRTVHRWTPIIPIGFEHWASLYRQICTFPPNKISVSYSAYYDACSSIDVFFSAQYNSCNSNRFLRPANIVKSTLGDLLLCAVLAWLFPVVVCVSIDVKTYVPRHL